MQPPRADEDQDGSITCELCVRSQRAYAVRAQVPRAMASFVLSALLVLAAVSAAAAQNVPGYWNGIPLSNPALLSNVRLGQHALLTGVVCPNDPVARVCVRHACQQSCVVWYA